MEGLEDRYLLSFNQFPLPTPFAGPVGVTTTSDGSVWFTERVAAQIGRVTPDGSIAEFGALSPVGTPNHIAAGADGNLWFTDPGGNQIGQITTDGVITLYPLPTPNADPEFITPGPDGAVWFTERNVDQIGRIDTTGQITEVSPPWARPTPSGFQGIVAGADGALWFTEQSAHAIGRMTLDGAFQEFALPSGGDPYAITSDAGGSLWFTDQGYTRVGHVKLDGSISEYGPHLLNAFYGDIAVASDGAVWFVVNATIGPPQLGRLMPNGTETFINVPVPFLLGDITATPDGNVWFAETGGNAIGEWVPDVPDGPIVPPIDVPPIVMHAMSASNAGGLVRFSLFNPPRPPTGPAATVCEMAADRLVPISATVHHLRRWLPVEASVLSFAEDITGLISP